MNVPKVELELKQALKGWSKTIRPYQQSDSKKAVLQIFTSIGPFLAVWVLMYYSLSWSYWITLGLAVVNAFFLVRIFIIQHDCGHQSFFSNKRLNNAVGFFCSFFSAIPFKYWAANHNFHHVHSGQLETRDIGDIQTLTVEEFSKLGKWGRFKYRLFRAPVVLFVIGPMYYIFVTNRFPFAQWNGFWRPIKQLTIANLSMAIVYITIAYFIGWKAFLAVQLPITAFFGVIAVWFFYVQHQHEHTYKHWKENWEYLAAAIKGSSYYKLPKIWHWLTGNIGYHHIHHLSSGIPNYNLARCAKENPIFQKYVTKLTFIESLKCMRHKLWDEHRQIMISFSEFYRLEKSGTIASLYG